MPSSIVTFTTDFGSADPYVAMMKGVVVTRAPGTQVIDISALGGMLPAQRSTTFHGRDIMAPLAGEMAARLRFSLRRPRPAAGPRCGPRSRAA
jgi:S-adenosylmethionine hydrolase